jgi:ArsR family transcriptional regulator
MDTTQVLELEEHPMESQGKRAGRGARPTGKASPLLPEGLVKDWCRVFKLLADETRFWILFHLVQEKELNVTQLCARLKQSQPAVSHHLALLRVAGLIDWRRVGKHNFYFVRSDRFRELLTSILAKEEETSATPELTHLPDGSPREEPHAP